MTEANTAPGFLRLRKAQWNVPPRDAIHVRPEAITVVEDVPEDERPFGGEQGCWRVWTGGGSYLVIDNPIDMLTAEMLPQPVPKTATEVSREQLGLGPEYEVYTYATGMVP